MRDLALAMSLLAACGTRPPPASHETPANLQPVRYLALGDSFTAGTGSSPDESFPARVAARCRTPIALRNLGVNGYTTRDLLRDEIPEVRAFAPTVVTLAIGANDIVRGHDLDDYRAQVRVIFAALVDSGVAPARVIALPQPDWSQSPAAAYFGAPDAIAARIEAFNAVLREESVARGARYVDLFPRMRTQARAGMIASDGLHPSARAYDEWAGEIAGAVCLEETPSPHRR